MTHVIAQLWVSVDGYAAGPDGTEQRLFAAVPPEVDLASQEYNRRFLPDVDEVLLGRRSYEAFSSYWPSADEPVAPLVNRARKSVASRTLTAAPWGEHPAARVVTDAAAHLRDADHTVLVWGSLALCHHLIGDGLVDELDLFVAPVVLGGGTPLVPAGLSLSLDQRWVESDPGLHVRYAVSR